MRRSTVITLGASAAFGVLAIVVARGFIDTAVSTQYEQAQNMRSRAELTIAAKPAPKLETVSVMVADMRLMPGDKLTEQTVNLVEYPAKSVPEGSYTSYEDLFLDPANPVVVLNQMAQGEPILAFKLSAPGGRASLSANLGINMRAVSIRVNDVTGVAGFVRPEDHVDVILTREITPIKISRYGAKKPEGTGSKPVFTTEILLQNIKVLAADQTVGMTSDGPKVAKTITLEVSALQAQKLDLAKSVGTMTLALRAAGTSETVNARALMVKDFSGQKQKPRRSARSKRKAPISQTAQVVVVRDGQPQLVKVYREQAKTLSTAELPMLAGEAQ